MDIIIWCNIPTNHTLPIFRELAEIWPGRVSIVFNHTTDTLHKNFSLEGFDLGKVEPYYLPQDGSADSVVRDLIQNNPDAIHLVGGGTFTPPIVRLAFRYLRKLKNPKLVFMSECVGIRRDGPIKGFLRYLWGWYFALRVRKMASAMVGLGDLGVESFHYFGFENKKVFPIGYCVDQDAGTSLPAETTCNPPMHFVFLTGLQEIKRKGIDILFQSLSDLKHTSWTCDIIGFDPTDKLKQMLVKHGIDDTVRLLGRCKPFEVFTHLRQNDVLLLPSRHDGWGVAVAEGIFSGLGVICSTKTGAKDLVESFHCGRIVKAGNVQSLTNAIRYAIENPHAVEQWKQHAREHRHRLVPSPAAQYLKQILEHVFVQNYQGNKPIPSWELPVKC